MVVSVEERITILLTGKPIPDEVSIKNGDYYAILVGSDNVMNIEKAINLLSKFSDLACETYRDCSVEAIINDEVVIDNVQCPNDFIRDKFKDEVVKKLVFDKLEKQKSD